MKEQEEIYIHLANSLDSLHRSWRILKRIKEETGNVLAVYAFQFALIEYSKPYKDSNSAYKNEKGKPLRKYKLEDDLIPKKYLDLHKKIITRRDKIDAHLDLDIRDAKVYVQSTWRGKNIIRSQNIVDNVEEMEDIDNIISLVEESIDLLRVKVKELGNNLPANI